MWSAFSEIDLASPGALKEKVARHALDIHRHERVRAPRGRQPRHVAEQHGIEQRRAILDAVHHRSDVHLHEHVEPRVAVINFIDRR